MSGRSKIGKVKGKSSTHIAKPVCFTYRECMAHTSETIDSFDTPVYYKIIMLLSILPKILLVNKQQSEHLNILF